MIFTRVGFLKVRCIKNILQLIKIGFGVSTSQFADKITNKMYLAPLPQNPLKIALQGINQAFMFIRYYITNTRETPVFEILEYEALIRFILAISHLN